MLVGIWRVVALTVVLGFFAACTQPVSEVAQTSSSVAPAGAEGSETVADVIGNYKLDVGDRLRIIVFNEPDLSGEFAVDDSGSVSLPLIGVVSARGAGVPELTSAIQTAYEDGFLRSPQVSIEVLEYRPFYISGEVESDGEYPYVVGLTVPQAVATAGGYTRRANKGRVVVIRAGTTQRVELPANQATLVYPGDVIEVPERFF